MTDRPRMMRPNREAPRGTGHDLRHGWNASCDREPICRAMGHGTGLAYAVATLAGAALLVVVSICLLLVLAAAMLAGALHIVWWLL